MSKSTVEGKISKRYDDPFKAGAVRMVTEEGLSQTEVARRLGVAGTTVCGWVRQLAPNGRLTDQEMRAKLRDELLNGELFLSLAEARYVLDEWRLDYNHRRPHSSVNGQGLRLRGQ